MELYWYKANKNLGVEKPSGVKERIGFNYLGYETEPTFNEKLKYDMELVTFGNVFELVAHIPNN